MTELNSLLLEGTIIVGPVEGSNVVVLKTPKGYLFEIYPATTEIMTLMGTLTKGQTLHVVGHLTTLNPPEIHIVAEYVEIRPKP